MNLPDLLRYDLGHDWGHDLDIAPPAGLLEILAQRSGFDLDQLRSMSLAGWIPWLLDRLDPDSSAFETYVHQLSLLLPLHKRPIRIVGNWRAWLPKQAIYRACPQCLHESGKHVRLLVWQLPLLLSCPQHGCWLESYQGIPGWDNEPCPPRRLASEPIAMMDRRTWQALTTGQVELPRRRIHAGLWFRLLRTLLDELSTSLSRCSSQQARAIRQIWQSCGYAVRAGQCIWSPYEALALPVQLQMLEAAATTLHLIETGALIVQGAQADLFLSEPLTEVAEGCQPPSPPREAVNPWPATMAALEEAIAEARHNPEMAQTLFNIVLFGRRDAESIRQTQALLTDLRVPAAWCHI